ncbi:MAG: UDP-3-O-acyl-N-acetylglucosamine deacetylase, partial [Myxococcota bacterium]
GLIKGGSLENAIVVDDFKILNDKPLRYIDEFVRHKILDALGDISLIGYKVVGEFEFYKAGHSINHELIAKILSSLANYEIVDIPSDIKEEEQIANILSVVPKVLPTNE